MVFTTAICSYKAHWLHAGVLAFWYFASSCISTIYFCSNMWRNVFLEIWPPFSGLHWGLWVLGCCGMWPFLPSRYEGSAVEPTKSQQQFEFWQKNISILFIGWNGKWAKEKVWRLSLLFCLCCVVNATWIERNCCVLNASWIFYLLTDCSGCVLGFAMQLPLMSSAFSFLGPSRSCCYIQFVKY